MRDSRSCTRRGNTLGLLLPLVLGSAVLQACSTAKSDTQEGALGRVHVVNQPLSLAKKSAGGLKTQDFAASASSGFTYTASVDSPTNPATGHVLQATNFAFGPSHAYVAYNMAGPKIEGALDVIDLSQTTAPQVVGSLLFSAAEFADVALRGKYALLVGAATGTVEGGTLAVVDVADPAHPTLVTQIGLGSHYGTSITLEGTTAYVSTGTDGGIVRVDITHPEAPAVLDLVALPNALYTLRADGTTLALGGAADTRLYAISGNAAKDLAPIGGVPIEAPGRMAFVKEHVITNGGQTGLTVLSVATDHASAKVAFHADLAGTGNGVDVVGNLAVLAQGDAGTFLYDVTTPATPALVGSFAFPDERGSANEVRFGTSAGSDYVFLSDGLNGFRIVKIASPDVTTGAACDVEWWRATLSGDWWSAPATAASSSPGTWTSLASETSDLCLVEQFVPKAANAACSATQVKRAIAIGPQPNEGQVCPVRCPAGTVIANVHSRYGEASPLNDGGGYTCSGTTTPDIREIDCDVMSDFCNGTQTSCSVTYHNRFCGDPWYGCIKSGRTKWQCVPITK